MTYKQIKTMLTSIGYPVTYDSFPDNVAPAPPYIVFNYPNNDDFAADNVNYVSITLVNIELYTRNKDFTADKNVEAVLNANGFFYQKNETYIRQENLFQIRYVIESIIKEN